LYLQYFFGTIKLLILILGRIRLNGGAAQVLVRNVPATNGVLHGLDAPLVWRLPEEWWTWLADDKVSSAGHLHTTTAAAIACPFLFINYYYFIIYVIYRYYIFFYIFRFVYTITVGFLHTITVIFFKYIVHVLIIFDINVIWVLIYMRVHNIIYYLLLSI